MRPDDYDRFSSHVHHEPTTGCWLWAGPATGAGGYGHFRIDGVQLRAPRVSYEHFNGPIPDGYEVDHRCVTPQCVNPDHLDAVSPSENCRRRNAHITHCPQGHEYTPDNTRLRNRKRYCRTCQRQHEKKSKARHRQAARAATPR